MTRAPRSYLSAIVDEGLWSSEPALARYLCWLFEDIQLAGARVLDVGSGAGVFSLYAAAQGAAEVTCLEPESKGSSRGVIDAFLRLKAISGLENIRHASTTLQEFQGATRSFDVALLHNSINHLDEAATMRLLRDEAARQIYRELFGKVWALLAPGGHVVITDCARTNLFPLIGCRHPINRAIEWHKHQDPELWVRLLADSGFVDPTISWSSFNRLGRVGWALLANRVGAFFMTGHFRLVMHKPGPACS